MVNVTTSIRMDEDTKKTALEFMIRGKNITKGTHICETNTISGGG